MRLGRLFIISISLILFFLTVTTGKVLASPGTDTLLGYWKLDGSTPSTTATNNGRITRSQTPEVL